MVAGFLVVAVIGLSGTGFWVAGFLVVAVIGLSGTGFYTGLTVWPGTGMSVGCGFILGGFSTIVAGLGVITGDGVP